MGVRRLVHLAVGLAITVTCYAQTTTYVASLTNQFGIVDVNSGVFTQIGPNLSITPYGLDVSGGTVYAVTQTAQLYTINSTTGATTLIGTGSVPVVVGGGLSTGAFYLLSSQGGTLFLYSIILASGADTLVGSTGISLASCGNNSLAGNATTLFVTCGNGTTANLYAINPSTGVATLIGPNGLSGANQIVGASLVGSSLYGFSSSKQIYSINTSTGAATFLTNQGSNLNVVYAGVSVSAPVSPTPPTVTGIPISSPSALVLLAGLLMLMGRRMLRGGEKGTDAFFVFR
jgi:hypothetical protein